MTIYYIIAHKSKSGKGFFGKNIFEVVVEGTQYDSAEKICPFYAMDSNSLLKSDDSSPLQHADVHLSLPSYH